MHLDAAGRNAVAFVVQILSFEMRERGAQFIRQRTARRFIDGMDQVERCAEPAGQARGHVHGGASACGKIRAAEDAARARRGFRDGVEEVRNGAEGWRGSLQFGRVQLRRPLRQLGDDLPEFPCARRPEQHFAGAQKTDELAAHTQGDRRFAQAGKAFHGAHLIVRGGGKLVLRAQADRARLALAGEQRAEGALVPPPVVGEVPVLHRVEGERKAGGFAEGAPVFLVDGRPAEPLEQQVGFGFHAC